MKTVVYKDFVGLQISGTIPIDKCTSPYHIDKAEWLTAQVESGGRYGTVINYDGTGMTAGLHQCIAVFPRNLNAQGTLWKLLHKIRPKCESTGEWKALDKMFSDVGWSLGLDGVLRSIVDGRVIKGGEIRTQFTGGEDGKMPQSGAGYDQAVKWAQAFHEVFVHPSTFQAQRDGALELFIKSNDRTKMDDSKKAKTLTVQEAIYGSKHFSTLTDGDLLPDLDLAMSLYWSNSVNAPGAALSRLCVAYDKAGSPNEGKPQGAAFAQHLIAVLGNTTFGRWDDDIPGGRYQRTRKAAMALWPKEMFGGPNAIMPADLPG